MAQTISSAVKRSRLSFCFLGLSFRAGTSVLGIFAGKAQSTEASKGSVHRSCGGKCLRILDLDPGSRTRAIGRIKKLHITSDKMLDLFFRGLITEKLLAGILWFLFGLADRFYRLWWYDQPHARHHCLFGTLCARLCRWIWPT